MRNITVSVPDERPAIRHFARAGRAGQGSPSERDPGWGRRGPLRPRPPGVLRPGDARQPTGPLTHQQAAGLIDSWCRFPVQATTLALMSAALATRERFGISYWDAAILEASRALGCSVVLSEDLDTGTDYAGVRVEDPFNDATRVSPLAG